MKQGEGAVGAREGRPLGTLGDLGELHQGQGICSLVRPPNKVHTSTLGPKSGEDVNKTELNVSFADCKMQIKTLLERLKNETCLRTKC